MQIATLSLASAENALSHPVSDAMSISKRSFQRRAGTNANRIITAARVISAAAGIAAFVYSVGGLAQSTTSGSPLTYPSRPVKIIVPFAPGGGSDTVARIVGQRLGERLGQPVIVENRPGASGNIGHAFVAKSPPDGHTILLAASNFVANPAIVANNPYDPVKDFVPITYAVTSPNVLVVHPSFPAVTFKEFMTLLKANRDKFNYTSAGIGTTSHLGAELLKIEAGIDMTHIPYNGAGPALLATIANQVPIAFSGLPPANPYIAKGGLRALAITSPKRHPSLPDVPTIAESGFPGFEADTPQMFVVPAGTPDAIVRQLNAEILQVLDLQEVRDRFSSLGFVTVGGSSEDTARRIKADVEKWIRIAKLAGITPE